MGRKFFDGRAAQVSFERGGARHTYRHLMQEGGEGHEDSSVEGGAQQLIDNQLDASSSDDDETTAFIHIQATSHSSQWRLAAHVRHLPVAAGEAAPHHAVITAKHLIPFGESTS